MAKENTASTTDQASPVKDVEQKNPAPPAPEVSEVKPEPPVAEGPASLFEMADSPGKKDIPSPENVVIPFEKINEIKAEKEAASGKAAKAADDKQPRSPAKDTVKKEPPAPAKAPKQSKSPKDKAAPAKAAKAPKDKAPVKSEPPAQKAEAPAKAEPVAAPRSQEVEQVVYIKLSELHPFKNHPFQVRDDDEMRAMVESVKDKGITNAAVVRPREGGGYEMVSGHRRMRACQLAGIEDIPVIVRNLDRDEAIISMVDSNLKREEISPMEKARAYQMKTDAMKRKMGRRTKEEIAQDEAMGIKRMNADEELAQQVGESPATIQRYKTLNKLVPELQDMVDEGKIPVNTGADIAQMKPAEQKVLADAIQKEAKVPSGTKAKELKAESKAGKLTTEKIEQAVAPTKREEMPPLKVTMLEEDLRPFFPDKRTTIPDVKQGILEGLKLRQIALERQKAKAATAKKADTPTR